MAGMAWLATAPRSSHGCCGPAIAELLGAALAASWSGSWMPTTVQTTRLFRVRDHGRGFVVGDLVGDHGFPHQQPKVLTETATARGRKTPMSWTCDGCGAPNIDRASCEACGTSSPTATAADLARTALKDAAAARAAQVEEAARGNHRLADHLGSVTDAHLDDALAMRRLGIA